MANVTLLTNDFSSGELSPKLEGAVDHPSYPNGCRIMENFIPMKPRGFRTIPGSYYCGAAPGPGRLVPWYAKNGTYAAELTNALARFWKLDDTTHATTIVMPYAAAQLPAVQWKLINNELYLVHATYAPRKIDDGGGTPTLSTPTFTGAKTFAAAGAYPSIIGLNQGRLMLGATNDEPNGLFQSRAPNSAGYRLTDFTAGVDNDFAIFTYQPDGFGSRLRWVMANRRVAAGADMSVWMDAGGLATPAAFYMSVASFCNCAGVQAVALDNGMLYIGGPTPSLHLLLYSQESGGLIDLDLTRDSDHILLPGVVEMAVQVNPEPVVWIVRNDGQLVGCSLQISPAGVKVGWGRRTCASGGLVESACVLRTSTLDRLYMMVNRGGTRQIERFEFIDDSDFTEIHYVDNGLRKTPASATVTGLAHLNGKTVHAIADGSSMPEKVVAGDSVTYDRVVQKIHIGQPYTSECLPQRPEVPINATWQGKKKRVEKTMARMYRSYGGRIGQPGQAVEDMQRLTYEPFITPTPFTGDKEITISGQVTTDGAVKIVRDEPFPLTVLAITSRIAIMET